MPGSATAACRGCRCNEQDSALKVLGFLQRELGGGESIGTWMTVTLTRMLTMVMTKRTSLS